MGDEQRQQYLAAAKSVVVKLGTQLLSDQQKRLDASFVATIAKQVAALRDRGVKVTIVSSGAIGAGLRELNLQSRPTDLAKLQAVAAVGQRRLMDVWAAAFEPYKIPVAQLLLTREDVDARTRYLNLRNTLHALHELGAVPIINENDTVSTDEIIKITFGDNDILAALVAYAIRADVLVLLSVVDGLLDQAGKSVRIVQSVEQAKELVRDEKSALGKGGMDSKLTAARMVTRAGQAMVVADGRQDRILERLLSGENDLGTLFVPATKGMSSRSRWIGSVQPCGTVHVDDGAKRAVVEKNKSLLPAGIVRVEGTFERGEVIAIAGPDGRVIARGLSNYAAVEIETIRGKKTGDVRAALGDAAYEEVIHRDNLVVG